MTDRKNEAPATPFAAALRAKPARIAREAERVMDSENRRETEAAQRERRAADQGGGLGEAVAGNVRSPLDRTR